MNKHYLPAVKRFSQQALLFISVCVMFGMQTASAISQDQRNMFSQGINYYDTDVSSSCAGNVTVPPGNLPSFIPEPYNGAFTAAGKAYGVSPVLIASIFTEEHFTNQPTSQVEASWKVLPSIQKDPNSGWATSPDQAMGPFQFIPSTWAALGVDADHNGVKDVENLLDASYGAANYMKTDGAIATAPKSVWVAFADGYSGHTAGYANMVSQYIDFYSSGGTNTTTSPSTTGAAPTSTSDNGCGAGAVAGNIVQTALNLAWDSEKPNQWHKSDAKPSYQKTMPQVQGADPPENYWSDCGRFVATVMRSSGVDPNYQLSGTVDQRDYARRHPELYDVIQATSTAQFKPGDILVSSEHTYIYVGNQPDGSNARSASWVGQNLEFADSPSSFVPSAYHANLAGDYFIVRYKG